MEMCHQKLENPIIFSKSLDFRRVLTSACGLRLVMGFEGEFAVIPLFHPCCAMTAEFSGNPNMENPKY